MNEENKGFGAITGREDPYGIYAREYVEVAIQGFVHWGMYQGLNEHDDIVLMPFVRKEVYPSSKNEDRRESMYTLVERPLFIHRNAIISVSPLREDRMNCVVERKEIIIPPSFK